MAEQQTWYATGKRKSAIARIWLTPGSGQVSVNSQTADDYFNRETLNLIIHEPLDLTENRGKYDIKATVAGGGKAGQAAAVRHGITRALVVMNPQLRPVLKKAGLITRDSRVKERKKYGQPGARKRFQYSKR
jgi:small subunit ribosomal protein S9